jgi:hypothetical protein
VNRKKGVAEGVAMEPAQVGAKALRRALRAATDFVAHLERELSPRDPSSPIHEFTLSEPLPDWPIAADLTGVVGECVGRAQKWIDAFNDPRTGPRATLPSAVNGTAARIRQTWLELGRGVLADLQDSGVRWARAEGMQPEKWPEVRSLGGR